MEKPAAPWPLLQIAIEAKSRADEEKLRIALSKLADEDPCFDVKWDEESGQTIIAFMGETELDSIVDRLRREFMINVNVGTPQVAYRETITRSHRQDYAHKRQFGGTGQFARVEIAFEPNAYTPDCVFASRIAGRAIPNQYSAGVEKGLRSALSAGPFAGFPMIGVKATLIDGAWHETDSSALAFEVAGRACFREAAPHLGVQLLEPIMRVKVMTPTDFAGSVIVELKSRRGQIQDQETRDMAVVIHAKVPLVTMFTLEETLRSRSNGQASLSAFYAGYAPVPLPDDRDPPPAAAMLA
jgi:translation elongation factor EF-G